MSEPRILAFSGSARHESYNQRLVEFAAGIVRDNGGDVTVVNLRDYPMPLMNQDLEREQGLPEHAVRFKALLAEHDALLISSPEYNSSITPLLKNAIDWASRRVGDEPPLVAYKGKVTGLLSASPGRLGGMRSLAHFRAVMSNLGTFVIPAQASVGSAADAFDEDGRLVRNSDAERVERVVYELLRVTKSLAATS